MSSSLPPLKTDASMRALFEVPEIREAFFAAFFARRSWGPLIDGGDTRQISGDLGSVGPEGSRRLDIAVEGNLRDAAGTPFLAALEIQGQWDRWMGWRLLRYQTMLWSWYLRTAPEGSLLPVLLLIVLYCGPERKDAAVSLLDAVVPVEDEELRELQTAVNSLLVDLNRWRSEDLPEGNPFRVLLEVLEAADADARTFIARLGGFAGTVAARPHVCSAMADVLLHAFFRDAPEGSNAHWIRTLPKERLMAIMTGIATREELMLYYKGFSDYGDNIFAKGLAEGLNQGLAKGRNQGLAEGLNQGLAKGRNQGLAEGLNQGLAKGRLDFMKACVSGRFGDRVAGAAFPLLAGLVDPADLTTANALLHDCSSGDEFLDRLKTMKQPNGAI